MEVILITPNPKYETLIPSTKIIESTSVDMGSLIETEVFLNHHYNISFYCIKNNFPYQFHCPLKISKQLLDRNEGAVELSISNGLHFKIESDTDTLEILSNVQNSLQGVESEHNVAFTLRFWEIQIRLYILNESLHESKIKETIAHIQGASSSYKHPLPQISRVILYIDDNNYEQFLGWSESDNDMFDYQLNEKLSHQYMSLKQEIDNEKNSFRNKIKMVEAILGENINIDKLLNEEKEENLEYKRLRETFETIKNIDNVLIDQERKLDSRTNEFKDKRAEKHRVHYENAKMFASKKNELTALSKEIELLKHKVDCVAEHKADYLSRRTFEPNAKIKSLLGEEANRCKTIVKNVASFHNKNEPKDASHESILSKSRTIQSLHRSTKKEATEYQNMLKRRVGESHKEQASKNGSRGMEISSDMKKYQKILRQIAKFYQKNNEILLQIRQKLSSTTPMAQNSPSSSLRKSSRIRQASMANSAVVLSKVEWDEQQFFVLNELLRNKSEYELYSMQNKENNENPNGANKVSSNLSISQKFNTEEEKERERNKGSQGVVTAFNKQSFSKIQSNKFVDPGTSGKLTKIKMKGR